MEPTPPYEQAVEKFTKFLAEQGWAQRFVWCRPEDVVRRVDRNMVVRRRSSDEAAAWGQRYYEAGREAGVGIALSAECEIDGAAHATIFWTTDEREAECRMMPAQGLKMSVALPRTRGEKAGWLASWYWRKRLEIFHRAIAVNGRGTK